MKKLMYYFAAIAAAAAASCAPIEPEYVPGEEIPDGCYGVYFANNSLSLTIEPDAPCEFTMTLKRAVSDDQIVVPLTVAGADTIFVIDPIVFEDGQSEAEVKVYFPKAEQFIKYDLSMTIDDPKYLNPYDTHYNYMNVDVFRVAWYYLGVDANGNETQETDPAKAARITWNQDWWGEYHYGIVKYYEMDVKGTLTDADKAETYKERHCFTVTEAKGKYMQDGAWVEYDGEGFWGTGDELEFIWDKSTLMHDCIYFPEPPFVYHHSSYNDDVYMFDWYNYWTVVNPQASLAGLSAREFYAKYSESYPCSTFENGDFKFMTVYFYMLNTGGWSIEDYDPIGQAEGFIRVDYSLDIENDFTEDGAMPVYFTAGPDVAKIVYAAFEGSLNEKQAANKVEGILADDKSASVVPENGKAAVSLTFQATGTYTVVAVSLDAKGNAQEMAYLPVDYVAAGDEEKCEVDAVIGTNITDRYAKKGYTGENSVEIYAYGTDIKEIKFGIYKALDFRTQQAACIEDLMSADSEDEEVIEAINGDGYSTVIGKLSPGTSYVLLAWVSNGYSQTILHSECTTNGDPLPMYMNYTENDIVEELLPEKAKDYCGTYNYYAINLMGTLGAREYLGKVTISQQEGGAWEDSGYSGEYLLAKGFAGEAKASSFDDTIEVDAYDGGAIYICATKSGSNYYTVDGKTLIYHYSQSQGGAYNAQYQIGGVPVGDGYIAFLNLKNAAYDWALAFVANGAYQCVVDDLLLADPAKDENGVAPRAAAAMATAKRIKEEFRWDLNFHLTPAERLKLVSERVLKSRIEGRGVRTDIQGTAERRQAVFTVSDCEYQKTAGKNKPLCKSSDRINF